MSGSRQDGIILCLGAFCRHPAAPVLNFRGHVVFGLCHLGYGKEYRPARVVQDPVGTHELVSLIMLIRFQNAWFQETLFATDRER